MADDVPICSQRREAMPTVTVLTVDDHRDEWGAIIRGEYDEAPGLTLTRPQAEAHWDLDTLLAESLLAALVTSGFLTRTADGGYARAGERPTASQTD
jgi:hypothetical protein